MRGEELEVYMREIALSPRTPLSRLMDLCEVIKPHPLGCIISFDVVPGSSQLAVPSGFNPWRGSIEAHLTEVPSRGRANRQLIDELARTLHIAPQKVEVLSGHKNARKLLLVKGMAKEEVVSALEQKMKC